jgi:membrane fusion protein (multidrug efflux system)
MALEPGRPEAGGPAAETLPRPPGPSDNHQPGPAPVTASPAPAGKFRRRWLILGAAAVVLLALLAVFGLPWLERYLTHVSTDDAYVNGHTTLVSTRVTGVVDQIAVDDNDYVEAGQVLVYLDAEPYRLAVEEKRAARARARLTIDQQVAALEAARADLEQARNQARSQLAGLAGSWFLLETFQYLVRYQVATLHSNVANQRLQEANQTLAQREYERVRTLSRTAAASLEELDQRQAALQVAREQVHSAQQAVRQARAMLGLNPDARNPSAVPSDLEQAYPGILYAVSSAQQTLAQLGVPFELLGMTPERLHKDLMKLPGQPVVANVPAVKAAEARVQQARAALGGPAFNPAKPYDNPAVRQADKELEQAELQLSYTTIKAPVAGYVARRAVSAGSHVQPGQSLLAVRPLSDVWVDANFKETQLDALRIGQPVDLYVDAYPGKVFHGRVAGFSPGTGAAMSLLPPENATGNFVKVVQRLPVRIELTEPNPPETPLFVGLSVVPEVDTRAEPSGPFAGQRLRRGPRP